MRYYPIYSSYCGPTALKTCKNTKIQNIQYHNQLSRSRPTCMNALCNPSHEVASTPFFEDVNLIQCCGNSYYRFVCFHLTMQTPESLIRLCYCKNIPA